MCVGLVPRALQPPGRGPPRGGPVGPAEEDAVRLSGREAPRGPGAGGEPPLARSARHSVDPEGNPCVTDYLKG